jgi:hypothetical protein
LPLTFAFKVLAIDDDVPGPTYPRDAVNAKTNSLVERDPDIEQRDWHHHRVNQRCCEQIGDTAFAKEARNALLESLMREMDLVLESNPTGLNPITPLDSTAVEFRLEITFESGDVFEQIINPRSHERSIDRANR